LSLFSIHLYYLLSFPTRRSSDLEFYGFTPIFPIKKNALNKAYYGKAFSRFEYMGEVSVICHLPFGAISAYVNHYSSPRREWNVGMTIGWQLFNYRFVE